MSDNMLWRRGRPKERHRHKSVRRHVPTTRLRVRQRKCQVTILVQSRLQFKPNRISPVCVGNETAHAPKIAYFVYVAKFLARDWTPLFSRSRIASSHDGISRMSFGQDRAKCRKHFAGPLILTHTHLRPSSAWPMIPFSLISPAAGLSSAPAPAGARGPSLGSRCWSGALCRSRGARP